MYASRSTHAFPGCARFQNKYALSFNSPFSWFILRDGEVEEGSVCVCEGKGKTSANISKILERTRQNSSQ